MVEGREYRWDEQDTCGGEDQNDQIVDEGHAAEQGGRGYRGDAGDEGLDEELEDDSRNKETGSGVAY